MGEKAVRLWYYATQALQDVNVNRVCTEEKRKRKARHDWRMKEEP